MGRFVNPKDWQPAGGIILEDAAERVVTSTESRSVIAGPGAGKTELLAQRALFLLPSRHGASSLTPLMPSLRALSIGFLPWHLLGAGHRAATAYSSPLVMIGTISCVA
jgi:hypothetical protein